MLYYEITKPSELLLIAEHFNKYPQKSEKIINYNIWLQALKIINYKKHLDRKYFLEILSLKSALPRGLKNHPLLLQIYPNIKILSRPLYEPTDEILNPYWIAGFTTGNGTFGLNMIKRSTSRLNYSFNPQFRITQHNKDMKLLCNIINTLKIGRIKKQKNRDRSSSISTTGINNIYNIIIPFFEIYPIKGIKELDYKDFRKGIIELKNKEHLNEKGLERIKNLYYNMNSFRKINFT